VYDNHLTDCLQAVRIAGAITGVDCGTAFTFYVRFVLEMK